MYKGIERKSGIVRILNNRNFEKYNTETGIGFFVDKNDLGVWVFNHSYTEGTAAPTLRQLGYGIDNYELHYDKRLNKYIERFCIYGKHIG